MRMQRTSMKRRGAIIPLVAICLIAILGMVALAIDIGMVAVAKTQAQNAADSAALAGTRTFNQNSGYNLSNVPKQAVTAAVANNIFASPVKGDPNAIANPTADTYTSGDVMIEAGGYYYVYNDSNPSQEGFQIVVPGKLSTEPYTAIRATITTTSPVFFGAVFGASPFNVKASAVAAHRPRDIVIVMDLSGSMRFQSCPGAYKSGSYMYPHWGPRNVSLNPDTIYPQFGHYSDTTTAALKGTQTGSTGVELVGLSDGSVDYATSGTACLADFTSSGSTKAFTRDTSKDGYATAPGGDDYLKSGSTYIKTVTDLVGASPTPQQMLDFCRGTTGYTGTFNSYTEGPGYWGKTFFIWPPNPKGSDLDANVAANHADNGALDWRQRFFFKKNTSTNQLYWLDNNTLLYNSGAGVGPATTDSSGVTAIMRRPDQTRAITENGVSVTYRYCINYAAIFNWLRNTTPTHFPSTLTTGRIKFYDAIPNPTGDNNFNNRFWTQSPMTNLNERFWKDYVDFMLGFVETGANTYSNNNGSNPWSSYIGNGDYYQWGTVQTTQKQDCNYTATASAAYSSGYTGSLLFGSVKDLTGTTADLPGPQPVTGATNTSPIKISSTGHGLTTGNVINLTGVGGNTAANNSSTNKTWTITVIDVNTFSLNGSVGNGTYTANTGSWVPAITAMTNASPIVVTTGAPHKMPTGTSWTVNVSGVTGNTAANGKYFVTYINATQFSLTSTTGNGTFSVNANQWWEPVYYIRFGYGSTIYELNPALTNVGNLAATADIALAASVTSGSTVKIYTTVPKYMDYNDNPYRPRHQFWFGPQSWGDWLGNYSVGQYPNGTFTLRWPGNVHEAQAWSCKIGISASIDDIKNNHPNDYVTMAFFSSPSYNTGGGGQHNLPVVPLGRNYQQLKDSLWFPPSTVTGTATSITPYDSDMDNVPRAKGGTTPGMGFMLAYNMLSNSASNLRTYATPSTTYRGVAGGLGRKGASRMIIFETDGAPNTRAVATLAGSGANSYYPIRIKDPTSISNGQNEFPSGGSYSNTEVYNVVKQICALETASPPGYSTTRKPAQVYGIGFGDMFDPANASGSGQSTALTFLQTVQYYGGVSSDTTGANFPTWQRIYGDNTTRQSKLQAAITKILQSGVQVSLLK